MVKLTEIQEVELIYKRNKAEVPKAVIKSSLDAFGIFNEIWDENKIDLVEEFKILLLRKNNTCIAVSHVSSGGVTGCIADPRVIFATALKANACQIILAHNHPSGNTTPSVQDKAMTEQFCEAGKVLDIKVLDHLIMTSRGYCSMADEGLMP
jgi:DNA repair protein RadC